MAKRKRDETRLSADDAACVCDMLRIASNHLLDLAHVNERALPDAAVVERFRIGAERAEDIRKAIERDINAR